MKYREKLRRTNPELIWAASFNFISYYRFLGSFLRERIFLNIENWMLGDADLVRERLFVGILES